MASLFCSLIGKSALQWWETFLKTTIKRSTHRETSFFLTRLQVCGRINYPVLPVSHFSLLNSPQITCLKWHLSTCRVSTDFTDTQSLRPTHVLACCTCICMIYVYSLVYLSPPPSPPPLPSHPSAGGPSHMSLVLLKVCCLSGSGPDFGLFLNN